jgi:predicted nucleic acid-binding protein
VELASLLSRRQRMGDVDGEQAERIRAAFDRVLGESLHLLVPTPEDFVTAADLLRDHASGLRAGDALHLAVARNRGPMPILTLDRGLVKAAKRLGIAASTGIRLR